TTGKLTADARTKYSYSTPTFTARSKKRRCKMSNPTPTPAGGETPETEAMARLYRAQVAPVLTALDTFAVVACTRILNKMAQIERERNQAVAKLAAQGEGMGFPDGCTGSALPVEAVRPRSEGEG